MSAKQLFRIPAKRRDALFAQIQSLTSEIGAIDRSLEGVGEGMAVDECLEEIVGLLSGELKRVSRRRRSAAA